MWDRAIVRWCRGVTASMLLTLGTSGSLAAQEKAPTRPNQGVSQTMTSEPENHAVKPERPRDEFSGISDPSLRGLPRDLFEDEKEIWTSPARLRLSDAQWLVPLSGIEAGLFVTDASFSRHLSSTPSTVSRYKNVSNAGAGVLLGGAAGMWALGKLKHNDHWTETGFLAGEAALNGLAVVEAMKYTLRRDRPFQDEGRGSFFRSGTSFPSEHAAAAWSAAGVIAHEYPGPFSKALAYGLASLVSFSRVRAHQHFPSDVLAGTIVGNLVAQNVFSRRHDPELGGTEWRSVSEFFREDVSARNQGSPYVPLDSWVYAAFDRLMALGVVDSGFAGMKPWTRNECVRLLNEAGERVEHDGGGGDEAEKIYLALEREFRGDAEHAAAGGHTQARLESVYSRVTAISGEPLTDGNHFAQTLTNDFGRPYQEGFNSVDGFSAWSTSGHWVGYVRGEYQHAPSAAAAPLSARQFIASADQLSVPPGTPISSVNQLQLLDAYVGLDFENWQLSFGRQSLWWSPVQSGPLIFSDNAEPVNMIRLDRVSPFKLPSVLGLLGPIRVEWFLGQLQGHEFTFHSSIGLTGNFGQPLGRQPFLQGQKISLKPTRNFELSVATTTVFAGGPAPLTFHALFRSYSLGNAPVQGGIEDPGDRRSSADFTYRIPGLRDWLTFYGDAMTEDEFSPIGYPRKSAVQGGLYLPHFPGIFRLDLRVEGGSTTPANFPSCIGCFYSNALYPDGSYVNSGKLMGSPLGRASTGEQAWSTYWITSRNKLQLNFRHQKLLSAYIPGGGTLTDAGARAEFLIAPEWAVSGAVQYEKWNIPVFDATARTNVSTSVTVTYAPQWRK